ncbi:MAG: GNAT family N-acetyltransferase [Candidatus Dadabacteria bacterium]|nr:GNAT family N-acetyltransferase [Candidatus Dadabacteria bacterium]
MKVQRRLSKKPPAFQICSSITEVEKKEYDSIQPDNNPFFEFDFLFALEKSGCVGPGTGWEPRYLLLREEAELAAAVTFYIKTDSYGEYIFDWQWARAYQDAGLRYYPKVVVGVPFTPANGPRIIVRGDYDYEECARELIEKLVEICSLNSLSSIHFLCITAEEQELLSDCGFLPRFTHQYHWHNQGYMGFDDFLGDLRSGRRKQIKKEKNRLRDLGVEISVLGKEQIQSEHMDSIWEFYRSTSLRKWGNAYLNREFFDLIFEKYREKTVLVIAQIDGRPVGGAINFRKGDKLYGRYWGCSMDVPYLHFECCYYRPIEFAIENRINVFEAGAQGEHKFLRGFEAVPVYSSHLFFNPGAQSSIDNFLREERPYMRSIISEYNKHSPLKYARGGKRGKII